MSSCTRIGTSVRSSPPRALYFCVRLYSANPQGLPTVCWCSPSRALYLCVLQCGASPNGLCAVRAPTAFVRCEPTMALCFGVLYELQELCACASLQRLYTVCARACASVDCTSSKSFARCEPTLALYFCVPYEHQELYAVRALYRGAGRHFPVYLRIFVFISPTIHFFVRSLVRSSSSPPPPPTPPATRGLKINRLQ